MRNLVSVLVSLLVVICVAPFAIIWSDVPIHTLDIVYEFIRSSIFTVKMRPLQPAAATPAPLNEPAAAADDHIVVQPAATPAPPNEPAAADDHIVVQPAATPAPPNEPALASRIMDPDITWDSTLDSSSTRDLIITSHTISNELLDELDICGRDLYKYNNEYRHVAKFMEHPQSRAFYDLYLKSIPAPRMIELLSAYSWVDSLLKQHNTNANGYQKLAFVKMITHAKVNELENCL